MVKRHRAFGAAVLVAAVLLLGSKSASAHEPREVGDGGYTLVVGFANEPAYSGFLNGLSLEVVDGTTASSAAADGDAEGTPVEGLEETLQAEIIYNDQTMPLTLEPRGQTPGSYRAPVVPMAAGDYAFRIFGTIGDVPVDETFTSSPDTFSPVEDQMVIQFPKAAGSTVDDAPVIGAVADDGAVDGGAAGGAAAGVVAGAAGLYLVRRRRQTGHLRLRSKQAVAGD